MVGKFSELRAKMSPEAQARAAARAEAMLVEMQLQELRKARKVTQVEVAKAMSVEQAAVSKLERRDDMYVSTLREYVHARLDHCPFQEEKSTCAHCTVHCYKPDMRERIRAVMRYSGPRMLLHHPGLAVQHLIDGVRYRPRALKPARSPENSER